jgi:hypothetical protein
MSKDEVFMKEAERLYSEYILSSTFADRDYQTQYHYFFNRAESRRLKKYIDVKVTNE